GGHCDPGLAGPIGTSGPCQPTPTGPAGPTGATGDGPTGVMNYQMVTGSATGSRGRHRERVLPRGTTVFPWKCERQPWRHAAAHGPEGADEQPLRDATINRGVPATP